VGIVGIIRGVWLVGYGMTELVRNALPLACFGEGERTVQIINTKIKVMCSHCCSYQ